MFRDPVSHPEVGVELSWSGDDFTHVVCLLVQERPAQEARLTTSPPGPPLCFPCFSSNREQPWTTPSRFIWDNQSSFSSVTVKTTLGQRFPTFMQRSKPSAGETPALLTRTSMFFWKNFSAAAQTFSHWALSVTSCSSNVQESSPNLWGEEGMFNYWMLYHFTCCSAWQTSVPACLFLSVRTTLPPLSRTRLLNSFPNPPAAPVMRKLPFISAWQESSGWWSDGPPSVWCLSSYCLDCMNCTNSNWLRESQFTPT